MNQEFAIESFISFCDDMMIAEEGFKDIIDKLIELLKKVVYGIQKKFNKDIILIDKAYVDEFEDAIKEMDLAKNGIKTAKIIIAPIILFFTFVPPIMWYFYHYLN